jgi:hypothetical protein
MATAPYEAARNSWGNAEPTLQASASGKLPAAQAEKVQLNNQQGGTVGVPSRRRDGLAALGWIGTYVAVKKQGQPWWVSFLAASAVSKIVRG